ncbi:MAG TPA: hypothetical protein VFD05_04020 [Bacilli bacterium]|nr:hypothetical protein [Bacilli bacterium]
MSKKTKNLTRKDYWAKYRNEIKAMQFKDEEIVTEKVSEKVTQSPEPKKEKKVLLTSKKRGTHELIAEYKKNHCKKKEVVDERELKVVKIIASILLVLLIVFLVFYVTKEKLL